MAIGTGASSQREARPSQLIFHARYRGPGVDSVSGLDALSGQKGAFTEFIGPGSVPGVVEGRNGVVITAGHGMPRWDQAASRGLVTRLNTGGEIAGQDSENVTYPFPLKIGALTAFWRVWPVYTVGENLSAPGYGVMLGTSTSGGGWLGFRRVGTDWHAFRTRGATEVLAVLTDVGSVFPLDLLLTFTNPTADEGAVQFSIRDANGTRTASSASTAGLFNTTESWGNSQLTLCGVQGLVAPGGRWFHEVVKVARGIKTYAQIDLMN